MLISKYQIVTLLTEKALSLLLGLLGFLFGKILWEIFPVILPLILHRISPRVLLYLLALAIISSLIEISYIFYLLRQGKRSLKFGVFWDKIANPYCPACKNPLVPIDGYNLKCIKCNSSIRLLDADHKIIPIDKAKKQLMN